MKKFISRVLICAMLISVLPKTNFADEEKVKSEAVNKEETAKNEKTEKNAEKKRMVKKKNTMSVNQDSCEKISIKIKTNMKNYHYISDEEFE